MHCNIQTRLAAQSSSAIQKQKLEEQHWSTLPNRSHHDLKHLVQFRPNAAFEKSSCVETLEGGIHSTNPPSSLRIHLSSICGPLRFLELTSETNIVPADDPDAMILPRKGAQIIQMQPSSPLDGPESSSPITLEITIVSVDGCNTSGPSGETATDLQQPQGPSYGPKTMSPLVASENTIVPPDDSDTTSCPLGEKATDLTLSL